MNQYSKLLQITAIAALALASGAPSARALPTMTISDGINPNVVIVDGGGGDSSAGANGIVIWNGQIGIWDINVNTGTTVSGSATNPFMDLAFVAGSTTSGGTLVITFSNTGYTYFGSLLSSWGGTSPGTAVNNSQENGVNAIQQGPLGPGAFSSSASGQFTMVPADVLSIQLVITHTGAGLTTGDARLTTFTTPTSVPEGGFALPLLGGAMVGIVLLRRKESIVSPSGT